MSRVLIPVTDRNLAPSGYQKLPSGLIMQWLQIENANGANISQQYAWPIPFTTAVLSCNVTDNSTETASSVVWGVEALTTTTFKAHWAFSNTTGVTAIRQAFVFAIGY